MQHAKTTLNEKIDKITNLLSEKKKIRRRIQSIESTIKIQSNLKKMNSLLTDLSKNNLDYSTNILKLEHILNEINQYYFHSKQCDSNLNQHLTKVIKNLIKQ